VRSTPAVWQMTSGARDDPPIPHSTTCFSPRSLSSARSASISAISGLDSVASDTQPSRFPASDSAADPHSVESRAVILLATWSSTSFRTAAAYASSSR
jgi:hypothetical protein